MLDRPRPSVCAKTFLTVLHERDVIQTLPLGEETGTFFHLGRQELATKNNYKI